MPTLADRGVYVAKIVGHEVHEAESAESADTILKQRIIYIMLNAVCKFKPEVQIGQCSTALHVLVDTCDDSNNDSTMDEMDEDASPMLSAQCGVKSSLSYLHPTPAIASTASSVHIPVSA